MSKIQRNILANYLGQAWVALMGLVFIPSYINYLGIEAFGLIGVFALVQTWLQLLDAGMTPTLSREMARFKAGALTLRAIRDLLRTSEYICYILALAISAIIWGLSGYVSTTWLRLDRLNPDLVKQAITIMAIVIALRFVEGMYRGALFGLQRQVWYNAVSAALATFRHAGSVAVLAWVSPTLEAFFVWQAINSLLAVGLYSFTLNRSLPPARSRFSVNALTDVWRFASGMMGITFLSLLLTQADKIILSKFLPLSEFGYYSLSATVVGALYMAVSPITQAVFPRMVELSAEANEQSLADVYHKASQLVTVCTAPVALALIFFGRSAIFVWSGNAELAQQSALILSLLAAGTFLHCMMWMPYQCQIAHGWTSLTIKTNIAAVIILIPAMLIVVPRYGAVGAACIWLILNLAYVCISIHLFHRKLLRGEKLRWYVEDLICPLLAPVLLIFSASVISLPSNLNRWWWFFFLLAITTGATAAAALSANHIRPILLAFVKRSAPNLISKY